MQRQHFLFLAALAVTLPWFTLGPGRNWVGFSEDPHRWERDAIVGTWTQEGGEPGNYIRLAQVPREIPGFWGTVKALEGKAVFFKQFGEGDASAVWNYENSYPLRLNIVFPQGKGRFLAVGFLDRDHARMRLLTDINAAVKPGVLESSETRLFVRTVN